MYRTHNCGELRLSNIGNQVALAGWVAKTRLLGSMAFVDLRDRYGITQLAFNEETNKEMLDIAETLGREFVIQVEGVVAERSSKNPNIGTGEIELIVSKVVILNESITPPFTIETDTDGGDDLRMQYRYLDLRRDVIRKNLELRHKLAQLIRSYLSGKDFLEVETPVLIKSTPEGARDFVVPSRLNPGSWYALPQSPQTFKQLLMVSGFDRYFQIVKCFRDEDLRADRQPEFTQIDCEMSFVDKEDVLNLFEGMMKNLFKDVKGIDLPDFPRMTYADAMKYYGNDKPDTRFGMEFVALKGEDEDLVSSKGFSVFDTVESVISIAVPGGAAYTRKQIDALVDWVKRPQIGATGLIWIKKDEQGNLKSSVDKFYSIDDLKSWESALSLENGDMGLLMAGAYGKVHKQMSELRLHMGSELGLRKPGEFSPLWVVDFPLLEFDEEQNRYHAMHHPFTSPLKEHLDKLHSHPGEVNANAYDMVINGVEIGGGSIRIHDQELQAKMFELLGFTDEEAKAQFGFLMNAFKYGAPPHGGIALGFDRLCSLMGGSESIRDFIAFPKNNSGRDVMIDAPAPLTKEQLEDLELS